MKKIKLILIVILLPNTFWTQDYFFEFVEGWINNFALEYGDDYHLLGLGNSEGIGMHDLTYNILNSEGITELTHLYNVQGAVNTGFQNTSQVAIKVNNSILIAGHSSTDPSNNEFLGTILNLKSTEL